jgi:hypothetical protein
MTTTPRGLDALIPTSPDPAQARVDDVALEAAVAAIRRLHHPVPADEACDSETWSIDHYGQAVDPYWIRCGLRGQHDEHGDPGNTGCTWPVTDAEREEQKRLPSYCHECKVAYPCPTIELLGGGQ